MKLPQHRYKRRTIEIVIGVEIGGVIPLRQLDENHYLVRYVCCSSEKAMHTTTITSRNRPTGGRTPQCASCANTGRIRKPAANDDQSPLLLESPTMVLSHAPIGDGWPVIDWSPSERATKRIGRGSY